MNYDEELKKLQEQVARKASNTAKLQELIRQREALLRRTEALRGAMYREQADVDRLEQSSLSSMVYRLLGTREERLDKEKREALAARAKYDAALRELQLVEQDVQWYEDALRGIGACEQRYEALRREKLAAIKASGSAAAVRILEIEKIIVALQCQKREIREAIDAGAAAFDTAQGIQDSLHSAEGWGTFDLLGGGILTDIAKHSHLDQAQAQIQQLQNDLRRFETELADVTIQAELHVSIDGFLRFADYFFDGLFADWAVLDKIGQAQSNVRRTQQQIQEALDRLTRMDAAADGQIDRLTREMDALVSSAHM